MQAKANAELAGIVWLAVALMPGAGVAGGPRPATLTVDRDITCYHPGLTDHMVSTDTVPLTLPEIDGPVSAMGSYTMQGTGYGLAGPVRYGGQVVKDGVLILNDGQWFWDGKGLTANAPGMPTGAVPVEIPLEPGAENRASHDWIEHGIRCAGWLAYRIDFERETQIWDIALDGERELLHRTHYSVVDPKTKVRSSLEYEHGVTFLYSLGARVTLERKAGAWHYKAGQVMLAKAGYRYEQTPQMYTILSQSCLTCATVDALAGQPIAGVTDGTSLNLEWPDTRPVVSLKTQFALQCAPGPEQESCERAKKDTTNFADEDGDFMQRAAAHDLDLRDGPQNVEIGSDSVGVSFWVRHHYRLKRIK